MDRTESETEIKVYSNLPKVTLYVDGVKAEETEGDKVFKFRIPLTGKHVIKACANGNSCTDVIKIQKVNEKNPDYIKPGTEVVNWFDREDEIVKEGYFSIKDSMDCVKANAEANSIFEELAGPLQAKAAEAYGDVAKNIEMPPEMIAMMNKMSVEASLKQMGKLVTPEFVHKLNARLNQVKK